MSRLARIILHGTGRPQLCVRTSMSVEKPGHHFILRRTGLGKRTRKIDARPWTKPFPQTESIRVIPEQYLYSSLTSVTLFHVPRTAFEAPWSHSQLLERHAGSRTQIFWRAAALIVNCHYSPDVDKRLTVSLQTNVFRDVVTGLFSLFNHCFQSRFILLYISLGI